MVVQRQAVICEFETSLVHRASFRTAKAIQRHHVFKTKEKQKHTNKQNTRATKTKTLKFKLFY